MHLGCVSLLNCVSFPISGVERIDFKDIPPPNKKTNNGRKSISPLPMPSLAMHTSKCPGDTKEYTRSLDHAYHARHPRPGEKMKSLKQNKGKERCDHDWRWLNRLPNRSQTCPYGFLLWHKIQVVLTHTCLALFPRKTKRQLTVCPRCEIRWTPNECFRIVDTATSDKLVHFLGHGNLAQFYSGSTFIHPRPRIGAVRWRGCGWMVICRMSGNGVHCLPVNLFGLIPQRTP